MNILYISYFYPPLGGPAAIRNQKTVKYLSELGHEIDVLTVGDIEYANHDRSLVAQCRQRRIIRTASLDPMALQRKILGKGELSQSLYRQTPEKLKLLIRRLYPLDDKVGWLPPLIKAGRKAVSEEDYDLVFCSCGPFSSSLGARIIAKSKNIPYVLDWRDFWTTLSDYDLHGSRFNRMLAERCECLVMKDAAGIVCATKGIAASLEKSYGELVKGKLQVMYNGHDEADFIGLKPRPLSPDSFILAYFGAMYARRSLKHLLQAIAILEARHELPGGFELRLYGNYFRETYLEIEQSSVAHLVNINPALPHNLALQEMLSAHALLLVINSSSPEGTLTSKVFEYLRCGRPILALVPQHREVARLLKEHGHNCIAAMESTDTIVNALRKLFLNNIIPPPTRNHPGSYLKSSLIAILDAYLRNLAGNKGK